MNIPTFQIFSLVFWLIPYIAMIIYQLDPPKKKMMWVLLGFGIIVGGFFIQHFRYGDKLMLRGLHILMLLYCGMWIVSYRWYRKWLSFSRSLSVGFVLSYVVSFYWEISINVYDLWRKGLHGSLPGHVLGLFPLVWLLRRVKVQLGWKNICSIFLGMVPTMVGVMIAGDLSLNIPLISSRFGYLLFCRMWGYVCMLYVFRQLKGVVKNV